LRGASHQTGWTGPVARLIQLFGLLDTKKLLDAGKKAAFVKGALKKSRPTVLEAAKNQGTVMRVAAGSFLCIRGQP